MERLLQMASGWNHIPTPFLAMDQEYLQHKICEFSEYIDRCPTFFALKANPDPKVLAVIAESQIGFEVSSEDELRLLMDLNVSPDRIISSNPVKAPAFISAMHRLGCRQFVFDSATEAEKLAELAPGSEVLIRLTVENLDSSWPLADKYGVGIEAALELLVYARHVGLSPTGVTFHVGSQSLGLRSWQGALERAASLWERAAAAGLRLRLLNIGGGFPARHNDGIPTTAEIYDLVFSLVEKLFPEGVEVHAEPGRGLVGDAGVLVGSVIGKAVREDGDWLYLDVGVFNGLVETVGDIRYAFLPQTKGGETKTWTIAGPSCDSFDVVAKGIGLAEPAVGDRILVYPAGAYTTAYASTFNGTTIPPVILG